MLGSTAKQMAEKSANTALVAALAPMCADKFRQAADASLNMTELKKASTCMQDTYIEKGRLGDIPRQGLARSRGCPSMRRPAHRLEVSSHTSGTRGTAPRRWPGAGRPALPVEI